jgi:hypothetical protein
MGATSTSLEKLEYTYPGQPLISKFEDKRTIALAEMAAVLFGLI